MPTLVVPIYCAEPLDAPVKLSNSACIERGNPQADESARFVREVKATSRETCRHAVDRALFTLRLWKPGMFACPALTKDRRCAYRVHWYCRPWQTWTSSRTEVRLDWCDAKAELPGIWQLLAKGTTALDDHRLRRFAYFYFYPVAVDRFSMLFMAADGLLFPYPASGKSSQSNAHGFAQRGARILANLLPSECEDELRDELGRHYKTRNGEFHGRTSTLGKDIQKAAERMECFVRHLLLYFLRKCLLMSRQKAEKHIQQLLNDNEHQETTS